MRLVSFVVLLLFVLAILSFSMFYTVRFTESAVVTTFGNASENSIITEPGLRFKLPYPVQTVTKYDTRTRIVQARSETQQTADDFQIIVEAYLTYEVDDPLRFFQSFSYAGDRAIDHFVKAEDDVLSDVLRSSLGETSRFAINDLFTPVGEDSMLPDLERRVLEQLTVGGEGGTPLGEYGIRVTSVGVDRVILPEDTTDAVITRMGANRDRLAERYESEGRSQARAIRAEADSDAEKIRAFARRRAREILAQGEEEAVPWLAKQNVNPDLAVFLENIRLMREAMSKKFTLVFSTSDYGMQLFDPDILNKSDAELPVPDELDESVARGDGEE